MDVFSAYHKLYWLLNAPNARLVWNFPFFLNRLAKYIESIPWHLFHTLKFCWLIFLVNGQKDILIWNKILLLFKGCIILIRQLYRPAFDIAGNFSIMELFTTMESCSDFYKLAWYSQTWTCFLSKLKECYGH